MPPGANVLVLDAGSSDDTVAVARRAGASVLERRWTNFVDARTFALDNVRTPWTFMLDADEQLDDVLRDALFRIEPEAADIEAYRVRRATRFCGEVVRAFGWDNEMILRMFRTDRGVVSAHPVAGGSAALHERWSVPGKVGVLDGVLFHDSYREQSAYERKYARYTSIEAEGLPPSIRKPRRQRAGRAGAFRMAARAARRHTSRQAGRVHRFLVGALSNDRAMEGVARHGMTDVAFDARETSHMSVGMRQYVAELAARIPRVAPELQFTTFGSGDNFDWGEQVAMPLEIARTRPRLVHIPSPFAPLVVPAPYVMTIHDLIDLNFPQWTKPKARWYFRVAVRHAARRARCVITDDRATAEDLVRFYGLEPERIAVIPLGVDVPDVEPIRRAGAVRDLRRKPAAA